MPFDQQSNRRISEAVRRVEQRDLSKRTFTGNSNSASVWSYIGKTTSTLTEFDKDVPSAGTGTVRLYKSDSAGALTDSGVDVGVLNMSDEIPDDVWVKVYREALGYQLIAEKICPPCITPPESCEEWCGATVPNAINADITILPSPTCYGGDQTGLSIPAQSAGSCGWLAQINVSPFAELWININLAGVVTASIEGLPDGNALFNGEVVDQDSCDNFDVTLTRTGGAGTIGACFGAGSTVRLYLP